jgi:hypothetical protein
MFSLTREELETTWSDVAAIWFRSYQRKQVAARLGANAVTMSAKSHVAQKKSAGLAA